MQSFPDKSKKAFRSDNLNANKFTKPCMVHGNNLEAEK